MSMLDEIMAAGGTDVLLDAAGDAEAVELAAVDGPRKYAAIVGSLRTEVVPIADGNFEREEVRDVCQVSIRCPAAEVWNDKRIKIVRYTTGDASTHDAQAFHVRSIDSVTDGLVTIQAWRESLVKIQRRGYEGAVR